MMKRSVSNEPRQAFTVRAPTDLLASLTRLAQAEGRPRQALLDDALREYVERREAGRPRQHVLLALQASLGEFDSVYRGLPR